MSIRSIRSDRGAEGQGLAAAASRWLRLAAAPTFAIMALTGLGGSPMDGLCSAVHGTPLGGMVPMYLLMSAFHSSPWLTLICGLARRFRQPSLEPWRQA